mgnify:FL=1
MAFDLNGVQKSLQYYDLLLTRSSKKAENRLTQSDLP